MTGFWFGCTTVTVNAALAVPPRPSSTLTVTVAMPGALPVTVTIPGTDDSEHLASCIFDPDYSKRDGSHIVFRHPKISPPGLLEQGLQDAYAHLYSRAGIKRRLSGHAGPHMYWSRKVNQGFSLRASKWLKRLGVR